MLDSYQDAGMALPNEFNQNSWQQVQYSHSHLLQQLEGASVVLETFSQLT